MFKENFVRLCNQKGESPSYVCKQVGITPATYSCWNESSVPRKATLMRIADYFGINVSDLLSEDEKKPVHVDEPKERSLHPEERILLSCYSKISDDDRKVLWTLLDKYMSPNEKEYFSQSNPTDNVG